MNQKPSDIELQRFVSRCDDTTIRELAIHLGMTFQEWEDLRCNYDQIQIVKCRILVNWREKFIGRFSNIEKALTDMKLSTHMLCQVSLLLYCAFTVNLHSIGLINIFWVIWFLK